MTPLERSYEYCRKLARSQARNFYYSFLLLPKDQRAAMCAIYAFMRHSDDLSDGPENSGREAMQRWRSELELALSGRYRENPCWPAFHHTVERYAIPHAYFYSMIEGVSSDLEPRDIATLSRAPDPLSDPELCW